MKKTMPFTYYISQSTIITGLVLLALGLSACNDSAADQPGNLIPDQSHMFFLNGGIYYSTNDVSRRWLDNKIVDLQGSKTPRLDQFDIDLHFVRMKHIVLNQLILDSMIYDRLGIDEQDAMAFYYAHPDSFRFDDSWAEVVHLGFLHFEDANTAARKLNANPAKRDSLLTGFNFDHQLVQLGHLPTVLNNAIFNLSLSKRFRGPIETEHGHHLVLVKKRFERGNLIPFSFVREQLIQTLAQANYSSTKSLILDSLYKDYYDQL